MQTKRSAKGGAIGVNTSESSSYDKVLSDCRKYIEENSNQYRNMVTIQKREKIKEIITDFVMDNKPVVEGYKDESNLPDTQKLSNKLIEDILNYGILTAAMEDEDVFEIRSNGQEIKVERNGRVVDLTDNAGSIVRFETPEQQEIIIKKLIGDERLTPMDQLVNSRTLEGFRIAAVHSSAMSPDPADPTAEKYHSFVLRKFKKSKMGLGEIVKFKTLSDNMARLLSLCPAGDLTFFTVGPTASGKTTTNNAILQAVPATTRTVLIQNPSEIDLRFKDANGRVINDVLHMEAKEKENPTPKDATMENIMDHTLRLSPSFVCLGEVRANKEFKQAMKIMQAGHPINTTFHAESSYGAIQRFLTAYLAESGNEPSHLALSNIVSLVDLVIVQKIMRDGRRRIIQISEILGVDPNDGERPLINDLYIYDIGDRKPIYNPDGTVKEIVGEHKRVGKLSDNMIRKFQLAGVDPSRFDFLLEDPKLTEVETYTGSNIGDYGMNKLNLGRG